MSRGLWVTLGTALGVAGVGGALLYSRRASAASLPSPAPGPATGSEPGPTIELAPLPKAADVKSDLASNWGETPADLRPLFMLMEETSGIPGSAWVFAVIAHRESRFLTTAHNGNATGEQAERDSARRANHNNTGPTPPHTSG
ncbi:MAG: hypothetical protein JNK56_07075 [Myxococcales bacterium]|nr:hypothetical protein [Myxococcales bacterium]